MFYSSIGDNISHYKMVCTCSMRRECVTVCYICLQVGPTNYNIPLATIGVWKVLLIGNYDNILI